jgi:hypothetical protein
LKAFLHASVPRVKGGQCGKVTQDEVPYPFTGLRGRAILKLT